MAGDSSCSGDLGVLVGSRLIVTQQCGHQTQHSHVVKRGDNSAVFSTGVVWVLCAVLGCTIYQKTWKFSNVSKKRQQNCCFSEEWLRDMGLSSLGKKGGWGISSFLSTAFWGEVEWEMLTSFHWDPVTGDIEMAQCCIRDSDLTLGDISLQRACLNMGTDFLCAQWSMSVSV